MNMFVQLSRRFYFKYFNTNAKTHLKLKRQLVNIFICDLHLKNVHNI